ncbi:OmpH family outer membrane protein [Hyphobacterium marinum]|uniref:OmpH family outer membrane protein n=1 Tax=Hyphobacterium marinum TaxID=3116574 RepID=A0ABU7M182_9PROT|nr:OmpH family outer membrane protein [Hyphobacterium sp. Y6023]MEE2567530.1 OmpH family outer membrane protein [Hyphobacterium sp. Y6023]
MKLHAISIWAAAIVAATLAAVAPASAQTNVLVFNEARVLRDSAAGQVIATRLEAIQGEMDSELRAVAEPIQAEVERLNAETEPMTQEAIQQRPDLMQRIQAVQQQGQQVEVLRRRLSQELAATERQALRPVLELLPTILEEIVAERGAHIIVDRANLVYAAESVDISATVIERLNQRLPTVAVNRVRLPQGGEGQAQQ